MTIGTGFSRKNNSVRPRLAFGRPRSCSRRRGGGSKTVGGRRRRRGGAPSCSAASGSSFTKSSSIESILPLLRRSRAQRAGKALCSAPRRKQLLICRQGFVGG